MNVVNAEDLPWLDRASPERHFAVRQKDLSLALGGCKDVGPWGGGHPFDVALVVVPAGTANWPLHAHAAQWEFYWITGGSGLLVTGDGTRQLRAGDCFVVRPGEAHQVRNAGEDDLHMVLVADNPMADIIHYPNSDKWMVKPQRKVFRMAEVDYYEGEA